jgi:uncharacterized protein YkwD
LHGGRSAMKHGLAIVILFVCQGSAFADTLSTTAESAISAYRRQHGLPAVKVDTGLMQLARQQAHAMARAGVLSHSVGGSFQSRMSGTNRGIAAENIAVGTPDLSSTLDVWKRSSGHRANLLKRGITQIGIASAEASNSRKMFWALVMAGSAEPRSLRKPPRMRRAAAPRPGRPDLIKFCGDPVPGMPRIACE